MKRVAVAAFIVATVSYFSIPASATDGQDCSYRLVPVSRSGSTTTAEPELIGCFDTYEAAIAAGLGDQVDLAAGLTPTSLNDQTLAAATSSDVLIGTEWKGQSYTLASNSYFAT